MHANVTRYYLFHFFLNLQLWWPIWIIYLTEERGLSLGQVTLLELPFLASVVLLQIPGAALADRFGRKPVLIAAAGCFASSILVFGLASAFWVLLSSYLLWGVSFSLLYGTESAFLYDSLKAIGREEDYPGIYGRGWAVAVGAQVTGTLIGAPLAEATSLSTPIILSGGIGAIAMLVAITFKEPLVHDSTEAMPGYGRIIRDSAFLFRERAAIRYAILFCGVITIGTIATVFFFQPFLIDHEIDVAQVGFWQTPMRLAGMLGALSAPFMLRTFGERNTFIFMPLAVFGGFAVLGAWDSVYAQFAFPLIYFAVVLSQPTITDYVNRRVASERRATVVSLTNLIRSAVLIPSAPLMGLLADEASYSAAYWAGGIMVAGLALPLLVLWLPYTAPRRLSEPLLEPTTVE